MSKKLKIILTLLFICTVITAFAIKSSFATDMPVVDETNVEVSEENVDVIEGEAEVELPENTGGWLQRLFGTERIATEYKTKTPKSTETIIKNTKDVFKEFNEELDVTPWDVEDWMKGEGSKPNGLYLYENIICFKHWQHLAKGAASNTSNTLRLPNMDSDKAETFDKYVLEEGAIIDIFDSDTPYYKGAELKNSPSIFQSVFEGRPSGTNFKKNDTTTRTIRSNYSIVKIKSWALDSCKYALKDMVTHFRTFDDDYAIPYILAFSDKAAGIEFKPPTESQKALWGITGDYKTSCNLEGGTVNDYDHMEEDLYKAAMGVQEYERDTRPKKISIIYPQGAQIGSAYYDIDTTSNLYIQGEPPEQPEEIIARSDTRIRIGPFQMSDYAYAFSEYVKNYSNTTEDGEVLQYSDVIGGIVGAEITITNAGTFAIGDQNSDAAVTPRFVYADWYGYAGYRYPGSASDVRGDVRNEDSEFLYAPTLKGTTNPRRPQPGAEKENFYKISYNDSAKIMIKQDKQEIEYPFPLPNSIFFIEVPTILLGSDAATISSAHYLEEIKFTYRKTETSGTGDAFITRCAETKIANDSTYQSGGVTLASPCTGSRDYSCFRDKDGSDSYGCYCSGGHHKSSCGDCYCAGKWTGSCDVGYEHEHSDCPGSCYTKKCGKTEHKHGKCNEGNNTCNRTEHEHDDGCYKRTCGKVEHEHDWCSGHTYANGGNCSKKGFCDCDGHGSGHYSSTHHSNDNGYAYCIHGHNKCIATSWSSDTTSVKYGKPLVRINEAKVQVIETNYSRSDDVRIFVYIKVRKQLQYTWHGWDTAFRTDDGSILDLDFDVDINQDSSIWDKILAFFFNEEEEMKPAAVGDCVSYRVFLENFTDIDLYMWARDIYPAGMVANDDTRVHIYKTKAYSWDPPEVVEGAPASTSARIMVPAGSQSRDVFFKVNFIVTNQILANSEDGSTFYNTGTFSSYDALRKVEDNPHNTNRHLNIEFNRTHYAAGSSEPRHYGPVITYAIVDPQDRVVIKNYVINVNKYISNVDHDEDIGTIGTDNTFMSGNGNESDARYNNRAAQEAAVVKGKIGSVKGDVVNPLTALHTTNENAKSRNPVYVEHGDRVTYKIEIDNTTVVQTKPSPYENPEDVYLTLKDTLPKKYSDLEVEVDTPQGAHYTAPTIVKDSMSGGELIFKDMKVPGNGKTTITIKLTVEESEKGVIEENKAEVLKDDGNKVYNINRGDESQAMRDAWCDVSEFTHLTGSSSDWYILNDYKVSMDKYISSYNQSKLSNGGLINTDYADINTKGFDNFGSPVGKQEDTEDLDRSGQTDDAKYNNPVHVEKGEQVIYSIKLTNESVGKGGSFPGGNKPATQVRPVEILETFDANLTLVGSSANIYESDGTYKKTVAYTVSRNKITLTDPYDPDAVLEPGDFLVVYVKVRVDESNMSLKTLKNTAKINKMTNVNSNDKEADEDRVIQDASQNQNTAPKQESVDYVRMKDLVIAGYVWIDKDKNGLMEANDLTELQNADETGRFGPVGANAGKQGVVVKLYRLDDAGNPVHLRTTTTRSNGRYTFSDGHASSEYSSLKPNKTDGTNKALAYNEDTMYNRIDKADGKDTFGNYHGNGTYIQYFVEFEYDGVIYKSTTKYAGMDNLTGNGNYNANYTKDSNAIEKTSERSSFNNKYQYIAYNSGFTTAKANSGASFTYDKTDHVSLLNENKNRVVKARSFVTKDDAGVYEKDNYLWLYPYSNGTGPETEYLKYINLGLELREEADISLTKDVYKVKTTINGDEMEYEFNSNGKVNGGGNPHVNADGTIENQFTNFIQLDNYIIEKPYGMEIYEADYKYRYEQYGATAVEKYKGKESELNIEVTYRIRINHNKTIDDEVKGTGDEPLYAQINEIVDLYDENFIKYEDGKVVEVREKDPTTGIFKAENKKIKVGEAWYYVPGGGNYKAVVSQPNDGDVPMYVETKSGGTHSRRDLTLSNSSKFVAGPNNGAGDGYNRVFISGLEGIVLGEGECVDIFVKYVVDKDAIEMNIDGAAYQETKLTEEEIQIKKNNGLPTTAILNTREQGSVTIATVARSLKLKDSRDKGASARGLENIAQVNAYSIWYDKGATLPTSLVDKDSNPGNIGIDNGNAITSVDNSTYYEDMSYKTGIEITAENTSTDRDQTIEKYGKLSIDFEVPPLDLRTLSGVIWDDSRSDSIGESHGASGDYKEYNDIQYIGNGIFSTSDEKDDKAMSNDNVKENYALSPSDGEKKDFGIRNVKAEIIEIVKVDDTHYYEEVLEEVIWPYKQYARSGNNGEYSLYGYVPGEYIVRFTYGDSAEGETNQAEIINDTIVFNGQDYKSTKFNSDLRDDLTNADIIMARMEVENKSDGRDDEVRRLEVNAYSEVMTNKLAEILKGKANGTTLTPNTNEKNLDGELKMLRDNTYMVAETPVFLVRPEKLTPIQMTNSVFMVDNQWVTPVSLVGAAPSAETMGVTGNAVDATLAGADSPFSKPETPSGGGGGGATSKENTSKMLYQYLQTVENPLVPSRDFDIEHVDFGIEYRPESEIRLVKEISRIEVITEDKQTLVDLHFYTTNDGVNDTPKHNLDRDKSTGAELVQFITNTYDTQALTNKLVNEQTQGFVYIQVDQDILQGCTIRISYKFEAENNSEVDRISERLDLIRYKENDATRDLISTYTAASKDIVPEKYTASGIARNAVYTDTYAEDAEGITYRTRPKTLTTTGTNGYFGRYVGHSYYTGKLSTEAAQKDVVATLKFDKILDYIDVNLEYKQESTQELTRDRFWTRTIPDDLTDYLSILRTKSEDPATGEVIYTPKAGVSLKNSEGYTYDTLVVSLDDRLKDDAYTRNPEDITGAPASIRNNDLSRFLTPKVTDKTKDQVYSMGRVILPVSKVLAADTAADDMTYENMAEVIQFTTLTGRRTNFATTVGNADIESATGDPGKGSPEFTLSSFESDTAATETVTLIPPTGLMRNRRAIVNVVETAKTGLEVVFIVGSVAVMIIILMSGTLFAVNKYKKRRIK